jgi:hypothetical protein
MKARAVMARSRRGYFHVKRRPPPFAAMSGDVKKFISVEHLDGDSLLERRLMQSLK